jgi:predicted hydrocarbon binding protein
MEGSLSRMPREGTSGVESHFEFPEAGIMKDRLTGARVFVMSRNGWGVFYEELEGTFFGTAPVVVERLGYAYGKLIGRAAKRLELDTQRTFEALFELAAGAGWGRMTLRGGDVSKGLGVLKVERCVFCEALARKEKVEGCFFLPGVVRGVADEMTGYSHNVSEKRCGLKGDPACEIHVEILQQVTGQTGSSSPPIEPMSV